MDNSASERGRTAVLRRAIYFVFSAAVTAAIFSYLLTRVSIRDVIQLIRDADWRGILMFLVFSLSMSLFRLWRYHILLRLSGHNPGTVALFLVVLVRNFFSDLLPARIGSLVYIYLVNSRLGVPFSAAAASFSLAFVFDLIAIAPMIVIAVLAAGVGGKLSPGALLAGALVLTAATVTALLALPWLFRTAGRLSGRLRFLRPGPRQRLAEAFESVSAEIQRAKAGGMYLRVLLLSVLVRVGKYGSLYAFLFALLAPLGYTLGQLSVPRVFLGTCASELAASLPISGIAGFGVYEGTWAVVFELLGFPGQIAKLTSISHHLFTQVYGYSLGAAALMILMLPVFRVAGGARQAGSRERAAGFYARTAGAVILAAVLLWACYELPVHAESRHARRADQPTPAEIAARTRLAAGFPGRIVFDSDRSGTFGIYSMAADGSDVQTVSDTPMQEICPDPSPDGKWIVFARAMSLSKSAPSEIRVCAAGGGDERQLANDGTFPTFSADGRVVFFERGRKKIMAVNFDGTGERELFPAQSREFDRYQIIKPRISPDGRYAAFISDRKGAWNTWYADLFSGEAVHVHSGCEAAWFSDSRKLAWVCERDAKERTGIFRYDLDARRIDALQDADAPRGHEYFPTVTPDDGYLLWSACREGEHEHTDSNYQIFVRALPDGEPVRVTFDGFDDRWPKVLRPDADSGRPSN